MHYPQCLTEADVVCMIKEQRLHSRLQWKRPTRGSGLAQGSMKKNRISQQTLKKRIHKVDVSVTGHLIRIILQICKISLILSEVNIHSSTPRTHSAHDKISSVSPHTDGSGS